MKHVLGTYLAGTPIPGVGLILVDEMGLRNYQLRPLNGRIWRILQQVRDILLRVTPAVDAPSRAVNPNFDMAEFRKYKYRECINVGGRTRKACDSADDVSGLLFGTPSLGVCSNPKLAVRYRNFVKIILIVFNFVK